MGIRKDLGGVEDLALGLSTQSQVRQGQTVQITEISARNIPYDSARSILNAVSDVEGTLQGHMQSTNNPHNITAEAINAAPTIHTHIIDNIDGLNAELNSKEPDLGLPVGDDYVLTSDTAGTREWKPLSLAVSVEWGDIGGNLQNQADLWLELDEKALKTNVFDKGEYVDSYTTSADAGKPIVLDSTGQIHPTLTGTGLYPVGDFTPVDTAEYPDETNEVAGAWWYITGVDDTAGYTFQGGDLAGQTCYNGNLLLLGDTSWILHTATLDPNVYYKLDGSSAITAPFAGGGQTISNIADGSADDDAVTVAQLNVHTSDNANPHGVTASQIGAADEQTLNDHLLDTANPHNVTTSEIGAATQADLDSHTADTANPHSVTASQVGAFATTEFLDVSAGATDAGKPIVLNGQGQIDSSMLDVSVFYYVSDFTPADGAEYPDTTGESYGAFWLVQGVDDTNGYTFQTGDLAGKTITNGDFMVWATGGWSIMAGEMNPTLYYKLDGTQALTAPFAGGGQQVKNIADGTDDSDGVTLGQMNTSLGGKVNNNNGFTVIEAMTRLTQAEYDALDPKDPNTMYVIVG